jgi:hypothetical protein
VADDLAFARRCAGFLREALTLPSGLVADRVSRSGVVEPTTWSYNQGLALGLWTLLGTHGDPRSADAASALSAVAAGRYSTVDELWAQPPCFVAVWFRMALLHDALTLPAPGSVPDDSAGRATTRAGRVRIRTTELLHAYLARAWEHVGVDGDVAAWLDSGVGRYGREDTLDTAGLVQLAALAALDPADHRALC